MDEGGGETSREETLVRIPGETVVHLVEEVREKVSEKLGSGEFSIVRLVQGDKGIALLVKVGEDVRWPLTKDEPILKIDSRHYLFSIQPPPDEEAAEKEKDEDNNSPEILNYGVTFSDEEGLDLLDIFLQQHACFSLPAESTGSAPKPTRLANFGSSESENSEAAYWTALAPRVENYTSCLVKAIEARSGQIIEGIFLCSNVYISQVHRVGEYIRSRLTRAESNEAAIDDNQKKKSAHVLRNIRRAKHLSKMLENLSENILNGVVTVRGGFAAQRILAMLPGDVVLASLDAFRKDALSATSQVITDIVEHRSGEDAAEITHEMLAAAGHSMRTAWNLTKILNPAVIRLYPLRSRL